MDQIRVGWLFTREESELRRIIPVWHGVMFEQVREFSPVLADRRAIHSSEGIEAISAFISNALRSSKTDDGFVHSVTVEHRFATLGAEVKHEQRRLALQDSVEGADLVHRAQDDFFDHFYQRANALGQKASSMPLKTKRDEIQCFPKQQDVAQR